MQVTILLIISLIFIVCEVKEKLIKNIKNIKKNKESIEKIEYYREQINDYSPLIYAKLLNKDIHNQDVITSTILYLEEKEIIYIDEMGHIWENEQKNILESEKFFILNSPYLLSDKHENNKNGKFLELGKLIYNDMINEKIIDIENKRGNLVNFIKGKKITNISDYTLSLYSIIASIILMCSYFNYNIRLVLLVIFWITVAIGMIINLIYTKCNFQLEVLKTKKGHELTQKMKAQKRFLKGFSLISQKTINDKIMWKQYIRSGIFFDLKGKLDKDSIQYFNKILNRCRYRYKQEGLIKSNIYIFLITFFYLIMPWSFLIIAMGAYISTFFGGIILLPIVYIILMKKLQKI